MDFFDFIKNNKFIILLISIIGNILLCVMSAFLLYKNISYECVCENDNILASNISEKVELENFFVEIKGAVKTPGVYEASKENIINDIVTMAGGFTKKAYTKNINLSRRVSNELVIYVYTESEYKKKEEEKQIIIEQSTCECETYDISNCTDNKVSEIISSDQDTIFIENETIKEEINEEINTNVTNANDSTLININKASKEELMNLSGIGESKAEDIVEYRDANGSFKTIEEIKNVSGIGDALFTKIKDSITI